MPILLLSASMLTHTSYSLRLKYELYDNHVYNLFSQDIEQNIQYSIDNVSSTIFTIIENLGYDNISFIEGYCIETLIDHDSAVFVLEKRFCANLSSNNGTLKLCYTVRGEIIEILSITDGSKLYLVETPSIGIYPKYTYAEQDEDIIEIILDIINDINETIVDTLKDTQDDVNDFIEVTLEAINENKECKLDKAFNKFKEKISKRIKRLKKLEQYVDLLYNLTKIYELEKEIRDDILCISNIISTYINDILESIKILQKYDEILYRTLDILLPLFKYLENINDMLLNVIHEDVIYVYGITTLGLDLIFVIDGGGSIGGGGGTIDWSDHDKNVECYVVVDEEFRAHINTDIWQDWYIKAVYIFEETDNPFESTFDIDFVAITIDGSWNSPNSITTMESLYTNAKNHVNWDAKKWCYEALIVLTEQDTSGDVLGMCWYWDSERGLVAETHHWGGVFGWDAYEILQHEESHLYYAPDHDPGTFDWCIMSYTWGFLTRSWCDECKSIIRSHITRF